MKYVPLKAELIEEGKPKQEVLYVQKQIGKFEIIPKNHELYEVMNKLVAKFHQHLSSAAIVLVWQSDLKPSPEKKIQLGKCIKVSDRDKLLHGNDFAVLLNKDIFESDMLNDDQRRAILDHELCHAQVKRDKKGKPKLDDDGKPIWRVRKHDLEEFRQIVERHGCYANDIIDFVRTALASKDAPLLADKETGEIKTA